MNFGISFNLLVCLAVLLGGCTAGRVAEGSGGNFPQQIGAPRPIASAEDDAYEQIVAQIIFHIEDGVRVLSSVQDIDTSKLAAGMFLEASDRVVDLRRRMLVENPRDVIPASVLLSYGPRYFFARFETEQQLKRIKAIDGEVHLPLKSVLTRLDDRVKLVEQEYEQAKNRETIGG